MKGVRIHRHGGPEVLSYEEVAVPEPQERQARVKLEAIGLSVGQVIERCRDAVISPCFLHHIRHVGRAKPGDAIRVPTLSAFFAEARDLTGIQWPEEKTPPSFHELRSLSARLYAEQGINAQALLGHKSADMTAVYRDTRGAEWIEVKTA